jgi:predicted O-methyltransferase YrrM
VSEPVDAALDARGRGDRPGFFIPHRHAAAARPATSPLLEVLMARAGAGMLEALAATERHAARLAELVGPPPEPRLDQDWFPRLDAALAYALVRSRRPRRIVEIGSGHSTRFMARAILDGRLDTALLCIDPAPRARLPARAEHRPALLQEVGLAPFLALEADDILFVDSSHVAMPGTDVDLVFTEILPRLRTGVLVHFHDCFLPDPYPAAWAWRGYNEQLLIAAWLAAGGMRPLASSHWLTTRERRRFASSPLARLPLVEGARESSLWAVRA